jgi:isoleucyl-tRNA synthetase
MRFERFEYEEIEKAVWAFWRANSIHQKANAQNSKGKPFYFLDGPPYTSGSVHIGTAWNKSMKDLLLRVKRMQGRKVWDRAGYDMHGLPNEHAAMKELGLKNKDDIKEYGLERFALFTRKLAVERLKSMNEDFERLGVWMDFENAYQTISEEWIDAVWWLVKKAHEDNRLYEGLRPMYWDPLQETALAKHELYYQTVEDNSIYVKFRLDNGEYLLVWTTTPWTIPFNLMVMVNPEVSYARVKAGKEVWIVAEDLVEAVSQAAGHKLEVIDTFKGSELVGRSYEHFLSDVFDYAALKKDHPAVHTVVNSTEYVTTETGTGLVHAAPGCGPEDYEVGVRENIPAWNLLDEQGRFPGDCGPFSGLRARFEDEEFVKEFERRGFLAATKPYVHEYPFAERSKQPIVYKTTKQWFFKVSDLKEEMVRQNKEVHWVPQAGFNAFNSWLENLRDNSISKQRFWGTPLPVWRNEQDEDDYLVIGSLAELRKLSGADLLDPHKPWIDEVVLKVGKKVYRRIPDVLDVWLDAGVAGFACLGFPQDQKLFEEYFPADFIIEGNDQVRGWFNLLMVASTLAFGKAPFRNVYMHGMINDSQGRKMSKSEGNYILPSEVLERFGADAVRLYLISATKAGQDLNYNHDDCHNKHKSLLVYWNVHRYLLDLAKSNSVKPLKELSLGVEERYILSKAHRAAREYAALTESYRLERLPGVVEDLLDGISRTYIQLVRQKALEEPQTVLSVLAEVYMIALRLLAPISPFVSEAVWQNLKEPLGLAEDSVHLSRLPAPEESLVDETSENELERGMRLLSTVLAARDNAQVGVRWPLAEARVRGVEPLREDVESLVLSQANIRQITYSEELPVEVELSPDYKGIGRSFGELTAEIATAIKSDDGSLAKEFASKGRITVKDQELGPEHLVVKAVAASGWSFAEADGLQVALDKRQDDSLLAEGFFRELVRRIQQARKAGDLNKPDRIKLVLDESLSDIVSGREEELSFLVGAESVEFSSSPSGPHGSKDRVKGRLLHFAFSLA